MEVKEFAKRILKEINEGVAEANSEQFKCYLKDSMSNVSEKVLNPFAFARNSNLSF